MNLTAVLVALPLALGVMLAATQVLGSSYYAWQVASESARIEEEGIQVLEIIERSLLQAGHRDPAILGAPWEDLESQAPVMGLDNATLPSTSVALALATTSRNSGSDVLAIRFHGHAGGGVQNCAGFPVAHPSSSGSDRGWSIFYVANGSQGQAELRCKYLGESSWASQALIQGVESFQVLYGLDSDGDGVANDFMRATRVAELIATDPSVQWKQVVAVRLGLLLYADVRSPSQFKPVDLFGPIYAERYATVDLGTRIAPFNGGDRLGRLRRAFDVTVMLPQGSAR